MAELELFGKCRDLGYCDCGGFLGCVSPALVACQVCDRSHAPSHPHIANIDGDVPIADANTDLGNPGVQAPALPRELPNWLKDKPGSRVIRPATTQAPNVATCGVCGNPWAPKHACLETRDDGTRTFNGPVVAPRASAKPDPACGYCRRAGAPCIRHGSATPKALANKSYRARQADAESPAQPPADERVAAELPKPTPLMQPAQSQAQGMDPELAAIGTILAALDGLTAVEAQRALDYVVDRKGLKQERSS